MPDKPPRRCSKHKSYQKMNCPLCKLEIDNLVK